MYKKNRRYRNYIADNCIKAQSVTYKHYLDKDDKAEYPFFVYVTPFHYTTHYLHRLNTLFAPSQHIFFSSPIGYNTTV